MNHLFQIPISICSDVCPPGKAKKLSKPSCCHECIECLEGTYSNSTSEYYTVADKFINMYTYTKVAMLLQIVHITHALHHKKQRPMSAILQMSTKIIYCKLIHSYIYF